MTASSDGMARVWTYRLADLHQLVRFSTNICLDPDLRKHHLGETREEALHRAKACKAAAAEQRKTSAEKQMNFRAR
jgi:RPA family protein